VVNCFTLRRVTGSFADNGRPSFQMPGRGERTAAVVELGEFLRRIKSRRDKRQRRVPDMVRQQSIVPAAICSGKPAGMAALLCR